MPDVPLPGDEHVRSFGTARLSYADGIRAEPGDIFELAAEGFGRPLSTRWRGCRRKAC